MHDFPPSQICISLNDSSTDITLNNTEYSNHNFFELRLDLLSYENISRLATLDALFILTCRSEKLCIEKINHAINLLKEKIFALDICFDCDYKDDLISLSRQYKFNTILSYHDFKTTPPPAILYSTLNEMKTFFDADFYKIVTLTHNESDIESLNRLYRSNLGKINRLVAFGMGKFALQTRIKAIENGCPFVFASAGGAKTAEGQPEFNELLNAIQ